MPFNDFNLNDEIDSGEPLKLSVRTVNSAMRRKLNYIIMKYLTLIDRVYYLNPVITIFNELLDNSVRANLKRVDFDSMRLDIYDAEDYVKGIQVFAGKFHSEKGLIERKIEESVYKTDIVFGLDDNLFSIKIINNTRISDSEMKRINERFQKGSENKTFFEVQRDVSDVTEGAGMGIVLSIFMLKSIGLRPEAIKIENLDNRSTVQLDIPRQVFSASTAEKVERKIIEEVNLIPVFPECINDIRAMCSDPESSIESVTEAVQSDPALSADVVKIANTVESITGRRVYGVNEAVTATGLNRLNYFLIAAGSRRILNERYSDMEIIWEHCNRVAAYACFIVKDYNLKISSDEVMVSGLLHDMGRVVFAAIAPDIFEKINSITNYKKNFASASMEEAALGVSHEAIGGLIALRWNFPDYLIEVIRCHHNPLVAGELFRDIVYIVYLANMLCGVEERKYEYYYIDYAVLTSFNLADENALSDYHKKLQDSYSL